MFLRNKKPTTTGAHHDHIDQILDAIFSRFEVRGETPNGLLIVHDRERNERRYLTRADLLAAVQGGTA